MSKTVFKAYLFCFYLSFLAQFCRLFDSALYNIGKVIAKNDGL